MDQSIRGLDVMNYLFNEEASFGRDDLETRCKVKMDIVIRVLRDEIESIMYVDDHINQTDTALLRAFWTLYNYLLDCNE